MKVRGKEAEEEQREEYRWEETLEVKVTVVNRKGSGCEGLNSGVVGTLAGCGADADSDSEALWILLWGKVESDLEASGWPSERH